MPVENSTSKCPKILCCELSFYWVTFLLAYKRSFKSDVFRWIGHRIVLFCVYFLCANERRNRGIRNSTELKTVISRTQAPIESRYIASFARWMCVDFVKRLWGHTVCWYAVIRCCCGIFQRTSRASMLLYKPQWSIVFIRMIFVAFSKCWVTSWKVLGKMYKHYHWKRVTLWFSHLFSHIIVSWTPAIVYFPRSCGHECKQHEKGLDK